MKTDPAFPTLLQFNDSNDVIQQATPGLTKRELFAALAMQGLLACPNSIPALKEIEKNSPMQIRLSHASVFLADALIAELERTK